MNAPTIRAPILLLRLLGAAGLLLLAAPGAFAQGAPVAMVSDVQGAVRLVRGAAPAPAALGADVLAGTRVELPAGASIVLLVLASGEEATIRGAASAQVAANGITAAPAGAMTRKTNSVGDTKLKRKDLQQAAIVMRKSDQTARLPLLALAGTVTLESRPVFRWTPVEGSGPYRFVLLDAAGKTLHEARTESSQLALPDAVTLAEGRTYSWEVSTRLANGQEFANFGDFTIADAALRSEAARRRPAPSAPFSERFAYAVWLDTVDLSDAAREAWKLLSRERPGSPELERMAGP